MKNLGHEEINGRWFSVYKVDSRAELLNMLDRAIRCDGRNLSDVYGKYSDTKASIFDDWKQWADDTHGVSCLGIASRNGFVFSLSFVYMRSLYGRCAYSVGRISKGSNKLYVW